MQCEINLGGGGMGNKFAGKVLQRKPRAMRGKEREMILQDASNRA